MNALVQYHESVPAHLRNLAVHDDSEFASGFENRSFARISTKDNRFWLVSAEGETSAVAQIDATGASYLDLCFVQAHPRVTKTYYAGAYSAGQEGVSPTCFSNDGITPDASSEAIQNSICATCRLNAFGSASNGKGKACQDNKRVAVLLAAPTPVSVNNAAQTLPAFAGLWGYKMPPMTAKNLSALTARVNGLGGVKLPMVIVRAKFVSQGVVGFDPIGYVTKEGYERATALRDTPEAQLICGTAATRPAAAPLTLGAPPAHLLGSPTPTQPAPTTHTGLVGGVPETPVAAAFPAAAPATPEAPAPKRQRGRPAANTAPAVSTAPATPFPVNPAAPAAGASSPSDQGSLNAAAVVAHVPVADTALNDMLRQAMA